jgi:hypothetical protein
LLRKESSTPTIPLSDKEPDLPAYTFARVLVTDSIGIAEMLIANAFHIFDNCPILSVDGYPQDTFATILEMVRRNPDLDVYALHDASVTGCMLPLTLRTKEWFPEPATRIIDLGLRPRQIGAMRLPTWKSRFRSAFRDLGKWRGGRLLNAVVLHGPRQAVPEPLREMLDPEEVAWLETGNYVELAVMTPERLMNSVRRAFRKEASAAGEPDSSQPAPYIWFGFGDEEDSGGIDFDSDFG